MGMKHQMSKQEFSKQEFSKQELLACPFCGKKAVFPAANLIHCEDVVNCCAQVELGDHGTRTAEFAVESWNRRVTTKNN